MEKNQTYREVVQLQIDALMQVYDNCEGLRDRATEAEKEIWNTLRRALPNLWSLLQTMDNEMSDEHAAIKMRGRYKVSA